MAQDLFAWMAEDCMLDIQGCFFADGPPRFDLEYLAQAMVVGDNTNTILSLASHKSCPPECPRTTNGVAVSDTSISCVSSCAECSSSPSSQARPLCGAPE